MKFLDLHVLCGRDSSVGIAAGYGLDGLGIESRWRRDFSAPVHTGPGAHPASYTMGTGSFPGIKSGRGLTLTPHSLLVPWSRKSRAIPLIPVWAVRPIQSLSACTRLHVTFTTFFISLHSVNITNPNIKRKLHKYTWTLYYPSITFPSVGPFIFTSYSRRHNWINGGISYHV
jgi:hypothetical protein